MCFPLLAFYVPDNKLKVHCSGCPILLVGSEGDECDAMRCDATMRQPQKASGGWQCGERDGMWCFVGGRQMENAPLFVINCGLCSPQLDRFIICNLRGTLHSLIHLYNIGERVTPMHIDIIFTYYSRLLSFAITRVENVADRERERVAMAWKLRFECLCFGYQTIFLAKLRRQRRWWRINGLEWFLRG